MFHSVLYGVQALAQTGGGPLLLILEDLHWADDTSLELLAFLASRLEVNAALSTPTGEGPSRALMILCTYRPEALPDNPALGRLLLHLQAQRQVQELHLAPLALAEHQRYVKGILEQPVSEAFARFLFQWDEGNPFYTEELLGAMVVNGQLKAQPQGCLIPPGVMPHLPPSLTAAILERFNRLPAPDQEVLNYAAVIGRVFNFPLLTALSGMDERELVGVLRRAISLQLISEVSVVSLLSTANGGQEQERYQFRHALTREAIYNRMLACERRLRHREVAQALEKLSTGDYKHLQPSRANSSSTHLEQQSKCRETHATRQPTPGLTKREEQVLAELAAGQTNREIAETLNISIGTVELHVTHILAKLGCETRTRAATYAIAKNLVALDR
jgi:predicted ATPase/DNA-binding CsgD family transcriptional regulator